MSDVSVLKTLSEKTREAKRFYYSMAPRERLMVNGMLAVLLIALIYLVLVYPAYNKVAEAEERFQRTQDLNAWMMANEPALKAASNSGSARAGGTVSGQALMSQINQSAKMMGIDLKRYEPDGETKLRVWLDDASFNSVMKWLAQLEKQHGIKVINISADAEKAPGIANFKVILGT